MNLLFFENDEVAFAIQFWHSQRMGAHQGKTIREFEIRSNGYRKPEHPTGFSLIVLEMDIKADNLHEAEVDKVIKLSEETYCPVWSMLKGNVTVEVKYNIKWN